MQAGGLGMVALGATRMLSALAAPGGSKPNGSRAWLQLCNIGLFGAFAVGFPGYFVFDAVWPSFYYSPLAAGKNAWLLGSGILHCHLFRGLPDGPHGGKTPTQSGDRIACLGIFDWSGDLTRTSSQTDDWARDCSIEETQP